MICSIQASSPRSQNDAIKELFHKHPNRRPFFGTLCTLNEPSAKAPSGAQSHRVILTRAAAEKSLHTLLGMAVDFVPSWDGHDAKRKCGLITTARISVNKIKLAGFLYTKDFPEVEKQLMGKEEFGMSWEIDNAHIVDMRQEIWTISRIEAFTGAAILLRDKAAYRTSRFELA